MEKLNKILGYIIGISLIVAVLGYLFQGVGIIYLVAMFVAIAIGTYFFFKEFSIKKIIKEIKEDDSDKME